MTKAIISGGQTGADRGGLRFAEQIGMETGGYAPKGWMTEQGPQPDILRAYGLTEWHEPGYPARTKANVQLADATVIFGKFSAGSKLTLDLCIALGKPHLWIGDPWDNDPMDPNRRCGDMRDWLLRTQPYILNVAGNRESKSPGIAEAVTKFLRGVF